MHGTMTAKIIEEHLAGADATYDEELEGAIVMADRSNVPAMAEGFARIHRRNLIAQGLVPLLTDRQTREGVPRWIRT